MSDNATNTNVNDTKVKKSSKKYIIMAVIAIALIIVISESIFILNEDESALVQRFGRIEIVYMREASDATREHINSRPEVSLRIGTGLKFKIPFIDNLIKYPSKLILYDTPPREVLTLDPHRLYFDNTAVWRIDNPLLFYEAHDNIDVAKERIDERLYSVMRARVGELYSYVLISDRETSGIMLQSMAHAVNEDLAEQGIIVTDIRIKRTDLPSETYTNIYNRMNTERYRVAAENRALGEQTYHEIRSETDHLVASITSLAERSAEEIRGEGDSEAARIYNVAYSRDPAFFEFYNLLDTYRQTVGQSSTMIVPLDSPFAKFLLGVTPEIAPELPSEPPPPETVNADD